MIEQLLFTIYNCRGTWKTW